MQNFPNIIQLIDCFEDEDYISIVVELIQGYDLFEYSNHVTLTEDETKQIIKQIVTGVEVLHRNGVVHGDIKLENIMMNITPEAYTG